MWRSWCISGCEGPAWHVSLSKSLDVPGMVSARLRDEPEEVTRPPHVTVGRRLHGDGYQLEN